jgi:hypothetical protein
MSVLSVENLKYGEGSACDIKNLPQYQIRIKMIPASVRLQKEITMENNISKSNLKVIKKESGKNLINNQGKKDESIIPTKLSSNNKDNRNIGI